ncbi:DUF6428 family protein [Calidithermus roseus]|uniref:Uncharacterized protein n=1 Tax=Calidithermus roseus TaxID=1644118 RepID=A0A399EXB6_9DEIN|nr:DUF6428 family protein [Calidithermus roseus]RIH87152.1 hypothetical protein Mrose_01436 [Calidithermus roseus]
MNTQEFLQKLAQHPDKGLVFEYAEGRRVAPGYHVTEIMNVTYESMDCGGQANAWRETVVQLMDPSPKDKPKFMPVKKFLSIYNRVAASVAVQGEAEVRFEYGNAAMPAVHYHVGQIEAEGEELVVRLTPPGVTCKATDRARAGGCCGPAVEAGARGQEFPVAARGCC